MMASSFGGKRMKPTDIRFTHDCIHNVFRGGQLLQDTFRSLVQGLITPDDIEIIQVVHHDGHYRVISGNRRLYLYQRLERAGLLKDVEVYVISFASFRYARANTTNDDGRSVYVRHEGNFDAVLARIVQENAVYRQPKSPAVQPAAATSSGTMAPSEVVLPIKKFLVAAIDFGTTYSGYAFSFLSEYEKDKLSSIKSTREWDAPSGTKLSYKAPTSILLDKGHQFKAFGFDAEEQYQALVEEEKYADWNFFHQFKMLLHTTGNLDRTTMLKTVDGKEMAAIQVFSMAIRFLKGHLLDTLNGSRGAGDLIEPQQVTWVLTVPAIWTDAAKQFMKEAALIAGINDLLLALEPEAASFLCCQLPSTQLRDLTASAAVASQGKLSTSPGTKYMVVDIGGGTVDITVHELKLDGELNELYKASGGAWGGAKVNDEFSKLLNTIYGEYVISSFKMRAPSEFDSLIREFEDRKRLLPTEGDTWINFKEPNTLGVMRQAIRSMDALSLNPAWRWVADKLQIQSGKLRDLFLSVLKSIKAHIRKIRREINHLNVRTVFLVGGFANSRILQQSVVEEFGDMKILVPEDAQLAVLKGAVLFGHNPRLVATRVSALAYGIAMMRPFEFGDPIENKVLANGENYCDNCFAIHLSAGQSVSMDEKLPSHTYEPLYPNQIGMTITIYSSPSNDVKYVTDPQCQKHGSIPIKLPDMYRYLKWSVEVHMVVGTEIQTKAYVPMTGVWYDARVDFLSN